MSALTDSAENKIIDFIFRGQALGFAGASAAAGTGPITLYVGLLTAQMIDAATGTEITGGNYARQPVTSSLANWAGTQGAGTTVASTGNTATTSNNNAISFPVPSASAYSAPVIQAAVYDSVAGGIPIFYSTVFSGKTVNQNDAAPTFAAGALTFQLDN